MGDPKSALDRLDAELQAQFRSDQSIYLKAGGEIVHSELCALFTELKAHFIRYRQDSLKYDFSSEPAPYQGTHVKIKCLSSDAYWDFILALTADGRGKRFFLEVKAGGKPVKPPEDSKGAASWPITDIPTIEESLRALIRKYYEVLLPTILPTRPNV